MAALLAGLCYIAGLTTLSVRMRAAGLRTQDFLPLFSLDELLRIGLTWISPAAPALIALGSALAFGVIVDRYLDRRARAYRDQHEPLQPETQRHEWLESFERARVTTN